MPLQIEEHLDLPHHCLVPDRAFLLAGRSRWRLRRCPSASDIWTGPSCSSGRSGGTSCSARGAAATAATLSTDYLRVDAVYAVP
jgi:hypothetical protein